MHIRILALRAARTALALALTSVTACSSVTDSLLEAVDPDIINPGNVNSLDGAIALYNGGVQRFTASTGGDISTWLFGGLLADEWSSSSTFVQNDETDQRAIQPNNGEVEDAVRHRSTRTSATQRSRR